MKRQLSLLEMLLIIMLIAITSSIFIALFRQLSLSTPKKVESEQELIIKNALKFYKLDNGIYPTSTQGLDALVHKPLIPPVPQHWRPYLDKIPSEHRSLSEYISSN